MLKKILTVGLLVAVTFVAALSFALEAQAMPCCSIQVCNPQECSSSGGEKMLIEWELVCVHVTEMTHPCFWDCICQ